MFHHEEYGGRPVQSLSSNQNESLHEDRISQVIPHTQGNQYYTGNYIIILISQNSCAQNLK
jgi:hypothetical protein